MMIRKEAYPKKLMDADYEEICFLSNPRLAELREKVALEIKQYFGDKRISVLEIGSGNGETTEYILNLLENARVVALDKDEGMVSRMHEKLGKYIDSGRLQVVCEDAFDYLKFLKDESFDCFTSSWTIHNFEKDRRRGLLNDVFRILKNKGLFVIMDKYYPDDSKEAEAYFDFIVKEYEKFVRDGKKDVFNELVAHEKADMGGNYIMREKESVKEMKSIGFKDVKIAGRILRESVLVAKK